MITPSKLNERGPARSIRKKINELIDFAKSLRVADSPTVKSKWLATGQVLSALRGASAIEDAGAKIQRFKVQSVEDEWLICRKVALPGVELSTTDYKVMKPIATWGVGGLPSGFNPGSVGLETPQVRSYTVTTGSPSKTFTINEQIFPPYDTGTIVFAIKPIIGGTLIDAEGTDIEWLDLNVDARKWEMVLQQVEVCVNGVTHYALAKVSEPTT
jgi:hypothetical protein